MHLPSLEKLAFVASLLVFVFLYGIATQAFGWFPSSHIERAWEQAELAVPSLTPQKPEWVRERVYERKGVRALSPDAVEPGMILIGSNFKEYGWKPGFKLIDRRGNTLHRWRVHPDKIFPDSANRRGRTLDQAIVNGSYLFDSGDIILNVDYVGTVRLSPCGRVKWWIGLGNHHSIARDDDDTFWVPALTRKKSPTSKEHPEGFPGLQDPVFQDRILKISGDGRVLKSYNVLDLLYSNDLERYIVKASWKDQDDPLHLNDVEPLPDSLASDYPLFEAGDLLVSLRFLDLVFVFDPDSETIRWHQSRNFVQQHDPDFIGNGWIGVFDNRTDGTNRGSMLGGSRIVAIKPGTDSTKVLFPKSESLPFYTPSIGQWEIVNNGNLLLTESVPARVIEVSQIGSVVWEWIARPYRGTHVPEVPDASYYDIRRKTVQSWPCSSGKEPTPRGDD